MSYLIQQMWLCLLIAALLGLLIGWWLGKSSCRSKLDDLDADWQRKFDQKGRDALRRNDDADISVVTGTTKAPVAKVDKTSYEVEEVEGIGPSYGKKLRSMGISTTEQLLNQCFNSDGRINVAEHVGIEDFVVRKWASMSDLLRVNGIEGQFSELMVYAGIDSVQDLGQQSAGALHSKLSTANDEQNRVKEIPNQGSLELMISDAKSLNAIMQDS